VTDLVRIQRRVSKKRYLETKRTYEYERLSLDIPRRHHKTIALLLNQDFDVEVKLENDVVILILTPEKTFRHAENTPTKHDPKPARQWSKNIKPQILFKYYSKRRFTVGHFCLQKRFSPDPLTQKCVN